MRNAKHADAAEERTEAADPDVRVLERLPLRAVAVNGTFGSAYTPLAFVRLVSDTTSRSQLLRSAQRATRVHLGDVDGLGTDHRVQRAVVPHGVRDVRVESDDDHGHDAHRGEDQRGPHDRELRTVGTRRAAARPRTAPRRPGR